jgi:hypothetical protein
MRSGPVPGPRYARIKRVQLPVDTRMVDDQDEVAEFEDEFEDYVSLKDRVLRGPLRGICLWTVLIAGAVWVVLNVIIQIRLATGYPNIFSSEAGADLWAWAQAASGIAYTVFLVALGSYVVLWLTLRDLNRDAPRS